MMKTKILFLAMTALFASCGNKDTKYDASGVFEATETTVSAEQSGTLMALNVNEGDEMPLGLEVGLIDTTQIWLKIQQMHTTKAVYQSQMPDIETQIAATRQQLAKAMREQQRYLELVNDGAAPSKMLDDARNQVMVLQKQINAQKSTLHNQRSTLNSQLSTVDAQVDQLYDQLTKCHVVVPVSGTVLEKYVEPGEFVATGKPLFKMADLSQVFIRAYVTTAQLQHIKIGQAVKVYADYGRGERKPYDGKVSWISNRSEFTPKSILTDDERADLVYAIKVAVKNDGYIKIGMYGEVKF